MDINDLSIQVATNLLLFDEVTGIESTDLTAEEIARLRPAVYRQMAAAAQESLFLKIHDAWTLLPGGRAVDSALGDGRRGLSDPQSAGRCGLLCPSLKFSYAHHLNKDVDEVIEIMARRNPPRPEDRPSRQLKQELLTWSEPVLSWVSEVPFPVHVVKYEDMHDRPGETFTEAARFCGLPCQPDRVRRAIEYSSFDNLKRQESETGFREHVQEMGSFFRQGRAGGWREVLTPDQIDRIIGDHEPVMERFGYLPS